MLGSSFLGVVSGGWGIGGGSLVWSWGLGVDSGALIGHISNIAVISIAGVLDVLDSAIGKSNGVRSGNVGGTIGLLLSVEGGLGVVISNSVGEGVGGDLIGVLLVWGSLVCWGGFVGHWSWSIGHGGGGVSRAGHGGSDAGGQTSEDLEQKIFQILLENISLRLFSLKVFQLIAESLFN